MASQGEKGTMLGRTSLFQEHVFGGCGVQRIGALTQEIRLEWKMRQSQPPAVRRRHGEKSVLRSCTWQQIRRPSAFSAICNLYPFDSGAPNHGELRTRIFLCLHPGATLCLVLSLQKSVCDTGKWPNMFWSVAKCTTTAVQWPKRA